MRFDVQVMFTVIVLCFHAIAVAQIDIEKPPISYSDTEDNNSVSELIADVASGKTQLEYDDSNGYLRSILTALDVHESTQALVFSKTSMQVKYISPRNPRAIYFNDDVYVGWLRGSDMMEISTTDPKLGAAFYTVTMRPRNAYFKRAGYDCLGCHATTMTNGVPGHTVRSVFAQLDGSVDPRQPSFVTDHRSPIEERWGGWYVTGLHGSMKHMGNAFMRSGQLDTTGNANRLNLRDEFRTPDWLSPYSDIVALMVLEHQTQMHNRFTKANFTVRHAVHDFRTNQQAETQVDNTAELDVIIAEAAKEVVDYMLFVDEERLASEVKGAIQFQGQFRKRGPDDNQGRSLREFDLKTRLFQYPCSYLIYSSAFDSLEETLRHQIYRQLRELLNASESSNRYDHLDQTTRQAISEILRGTKPELREFWQKLDSIEARDDGSEPSQRP